jgi:uncharacterized protein YcnI
MFAKVLAAALALAASLAAAHVTSVQKTAVVGYTATCFRVPHSCSDPKANTIMLNTTSVVITIPRTVTGVKPMPVPGWTISFAPGKDYADAPSTCQ